MTAPNLIRLTCTQCGLRYRGADDGWDAVCVTCRVLASTDAKCDACGYVEHDEPTHADNAHDNLCCGTAVLCAWATGPDLCITHDTRSDWT